MEPDILNDFLDIPRGSNFFEDAVNNKFRVTFDHNLTLTSINGNSETIPESNTFSHIYGIFTNVIGISQ